MILLPCTIAFDSPATIKTAKAKPDKDIIVSSFSLPKRKKIIREITLENPRIATFPKMLSTKLPSPKFV